MGLMTSRIGQIWVFLSAQSHLGLFVLHGGPRVDDDNLPNNYNLNVKQKKSHSIVLSSQLTLLPPQTVAKNTPVRQKRKVS